MGDNDNNPPSDVENQLISLIQSVRPESGPLLQMLTAVENWLWWGKLGVTACAVSITSAIVIGEWQGLLILVTAFGTLAMAFMIDWLERTLHGRWQQRWAFDRGRFTRRRKFERICTERGHCVVCRTIQAMPSTSIGSTPAL